MNFDQSRANASLTYLEDGFFFDGVRVRPAESDLLQEGRCLLARDRTDSPALPRATAGNTVELEASVVCYNAQLNVRPRPSSVSESNLSVYSFAMGTVNSPNRFSRS